MAIQSGIGVGEAQVYNTNGSLNTYAKLIQTQQLQRQAEQKALAEQLAQVKTDGVREKDQPIFNKMYQDVKGLQLQYQQAHSDQERMNIQAQMSKGMQQAANFRDNSISEGKKDDQWATMLYDPEKRSQFADNAVSNIQRNFTLPITDPNYIKDRTQFERKLDGTKVEDAVGKINKGLVSNAQWDDPRLHIANGFIKNERHVDPNAASTAYNMLYNASDDMKEYMKQKYPDIYANHDPNTAKSLAIQSYVKENQAANKLSEYDKPTRQIVDHHGEPTYADIHGTYGERNPNGSTNDPTIDRQKVAAGLLKFDQNAVNQTLQYAPKGSAINFHPVIGDPTKTIIRFHSPAVESSVTGKTTREAIDEDIYPWEGDPSNRINYLLGEMTGQKVSSNNFNTVKGAKAGDKYVVNNPSANQTNSTPVVTPKKEQIVSYVDNGTQYKIPKSKVAGFLKAKPKAKKL